MNMNIRIRIRVVDLNCDRGFTWMHRMKGIGERVVFEGIGLFCLVFRLDCIVFRWHSCDDAL